MARIRTDLPVLPSLLDRLIDDDPDRSLEAVKPAGVVLADIKANIRRDLENLLNTRIYRQLSIDAYPELQKSLVNYGIKDFSHVQFDSDEELIQFAWSIRRAIEDYEPRFQWVQVDIEPFGEDFQRTLYLKISATLLIEPDPVPLIFDSRVRTTDRALKLREVNHG